MDLTLDRLEYTKNGIFGELIDDVDNILCYTLEHAFLQEDGSYLPAVPNGKYTCVKRLSPRFGFDVFMLENVPGHDYIEFHPGNTNADSDGCILVGSHILDHEQIIDSRNAFKAFMLAQGELNQFTLTVI